MKIFLTGFTQIFLVVINTFFVTHVIYLGVGITSFLIAMTWSYNVKKAAFGSFKERIYYALGSTCGAIIGLWISNNITTIFY
jgi:hypothetical protein